MLNRRETLMLAGLLALSWLVALVVYPQLPERVAVHWGLQGQPTRWEPRFWGTFWGPAFLTGLALLYFWVVPAIDPWRKNLQAFRQAYKHLGWALLLFLAVMYGYTLLWNLGWALDLTRMVALALAALMAVMAYVLRHARPNWFLGVRTPWTLSSPLVWHQVHQHASVTLWGVVVLFLVAVVWPVVFWVALGALYLWAGSLVVYSYLLYRRYEMQAQREQG